MTTQARAEILPFGSKEQIQSIGLRYEVLRKPLGLFFNAEDLKAEQHEQHLGIVEGETVVACMILKPAGAGLVKMRQVAVAEKKTKKGYGKMLVQFGEMWCRQNGITRIELHARETAVPFYLQLGYSIDKEPFTEVGLPHRFMFRDLE